MKHALRNWSQTDSKIILLQQRSIWKTSFVIDIVGILRYLLQQLPSYFWIMKFPWNIIFSKLLSTLHCWLVFSMMNNLNASVMKRIYSNKLILKEIYREKWTNHTTKTTRNLDSLDTMNMAINSSTYFITKRG